MEADSFLAWLYNKYKEYTKAEEILRKQLARNKDDKWTLSELGSFGGLYSANELLKMKKLNSHII